MKFLCITAALWVCAVPAHAARPSFDARACAAAAAAAGARCGVVHVPENPAWRSGRKIGLNVMVLPATGPARDARRAQYDLEGGPGFAATDFLAFYAGEGAIYRQDRDIVLADLRGTGDSSPLRCAGIEELEKRDPAALMYPPVLVAECAQQSQVAADPRQYTTAIAARDIEHVRRALGYEQLSLNAISYGTTLALQYMADFPGRVHSAVLTGTVPATRTPPRYHAVAAQAAFEELVADCVADVGCRKNFGDPRENLRSALERLAASSLPAPVFFESLRTRLYAPASRARIPGLLARAAAGDFSEFLKPRDDRRTFADGLYLSITCTESFAAMDAPAAIAASRDTLFGAYRLERQAEACKHWPTGVAPKPGRPSGPAEIPVLFIAGALDPVSPADWAQEAAAGFPKSTLIRVPKGAHVLDGLTDLDTCLDAVILRFLEDPARPPDTACFAAMMPPGFEGS